MTDNVLVLPPIIVERPDYLIKIISHCVDREWKKTLVFQAKPESVKTYRQIWEEVDEYEKNIGENNEYAQKNQHKKYRQVCRCPVCRSK